MTVKTSCLSESKYLLERAMRTRGITPKIENRTFTVSMTVGRYSLSFMPGNRRTLISHDVFVEPEFRSQGIGKTGLRIREELAREIGVNLLLATVRNDNAIEIHLLEKNGWKRFTNRDTGVSLFGKEL